jgi:hypothetical protein
MSDEIKLGRCLLNGFPSVIRKINKINDHKTIICFFYGKGGGNRCESIEDFKKGYKYELIV